MTPERWQQVKETLASALEQETAPARADFLAQVSEDDPDLCQEVETLLKHSPDAFQSWADGGGFLRSESSTAANEGRRIGAYELVRELGRGGMGAVWLARRADDRFEQQVAIKLLKRGTDTEEVLRRFRSERQILASLEHPNIARLIDGGETDDGLPFFVMEFIADGEPLTVYARTRALSVSARLDLFRKICATVQFAHQNLVVHRDLKPENILVTAAGEPKLLDFGIAKLLGPGEQSWAMTIAGTERLTPAYASPEQVRGETVTTVSDVYSLGALLYELIAGRPPHRFVAVSPAPAELVRVIGGEEPLHPRLAADTPEARRQLRGDLSNIILKALRKEPARRYASVGELAEDLRRYSQKRPVRARPDTLAYRTGKFLLRNKTGALAATLVLIASVVGALATLWQAHQARDRFNDVRGLANSFLFEFHDAIRDLPGSTPARRLLVTRALDYLRRLEQNGGARDPALRCELATAYLRVGDVQGRPNSPNIGDTAGALVSYRHGVALSEALPEEGSDVVRGEAWDALARLLAATGAQREALELAARSLKSREQVLASHPSDANAQRAVAASLIAVGDIRLQNTIAVSPQPEDTAAGQVFYTRALALREDLHAANPADTDTTRDLAAVHYQLANLFHLQGLHPPGNDNLIRRGLEHHQISIALREEILAAHPSSGRAQRDLADGLAMKTDMQTKLGDAAGAQADCERALNLFVGLVDADPENIWAKQDLAFAFYELSLPQRALGDTSAAGESLDKSVGIYDTLAAADATNLTLIAQLNHLLRLRTDICETRGDAVGFRESARRWEEFASRLAASAPLDEAQRADWKAAKEAYQRALNLPQS